MMGRDELVGSSRSDNIFRITSLAIGKLTSSLHLPFDQHDLASGKSSCLEEETTRVSSCVLDLTSITNHEGGVQNQNGS